MPLRTTQKKKLEIYIPNKGRGIPLIAIGIVAVAIMTALGAARESRQDYRNDIIASNGSNVLSGDTSASCSKAGVNFAAAFDSMITPNFERAQSHKMGWVLAIAVNKDEAPGVADRINAASEFGLTTIVRICYHDNCGFKEPQDYIDFLKDVASRTSVPFYAIAGPNEPLNENWLKDTENIPVPIPQNDDQIKEVGRAAAIYMNSVINGMEGTANVNLLSPAFNLTRADKQKLLDAMNQNGANFDGLVGIAGNLYNIQGSTITQWVTETKAMFPGKDLYITETGDYEHNINLLASETKNTLFPDATIKAFLLFNAFATNPGFENFHLEDEEIAEVLGGDCSTVSPGGQTGDTIGDMVSACPFDGDFSSDLVSCQINTAKQTAAKGDCGPGTELCGEMKMLKCGVNYTCSATNTLIPDDDLWHGGYDLTANVEGLPGEGIATIGYLQSAIADYAYDGREHQLVPPCYYRNANNYFSDVDFGRKFDGRVGIFAGGEETQLSFPLLGSAAGCLFYNNNDYHGSFNLIASGFVEEGSSLAGATTPFLASGSTSSNGRVNGIFDFISGPILALQGFIQKTFFDRSVASDYYETPVSFCSANPPGIPVSKLNTKDVVAASKSYESLMEQERANLTDTELCDRQLFQKDIEGALCNVNGIVFTTSPTITSFDSSGNPIVIKYEDEKAKNNGVVDSATGNPILTKDRERTEEIDLDGMMRGIASAYLDEAIFFHGLGTRPGTTPVNTVEDTPSGFRVIHNVNTGVEVPLTTRIYDILETQGTSNYICRDEEVLTPIFNPGDDAAGQVLGAGFSGLVEQNQLIQNQFTPCGWTAFAGSNGDQPESAIVNAGDGRSDQAYFKIQNNFGMDDIGQLRALGGIQTTACGYSPGESVTFSVEAESWCGVPDAADSNGCYAGVGFGTPNQEVSSTNGYTFIPGQNAHAGGSWTNLSATGTADASGCVSIYIQGITEFPTEYTSFFFRNPTLSGNGVIDINGAQCFWQNGINGCTGTDFCSTQFTSTIQQVCVPAENVTGPVSEQTQCEAGNFYKGNFELAKGKSEGKDYYIVPWMAQIPRMFGRVAAVGTNYMVDESGDLIGTSSGNPALDGERIPLCANAAPGQDCLVKFGDPTPDPLFEWLKSEGALTDAEINGAFGQSGEVGTDMCIEEAVVADDFESLLKRATDFINSQTGGSRIPWYVLWGVTYNEVWTRCPQSFADWYSNAESTTLLGMTDSGEVYDWADKCTGDPYQLALYQDFQPNDGEGRGIGGFMPDTTASLLTDSYWFDSDKLPASTHETDTGALIDACIANLGISDRSKGKNYTTGVEDSALDEGLDPALQDIFSRGRLGDTICAMAVMLSENAAYFSGGNYIPEDQWTDDDITRAARAYGPNGACDPGKDYCFNAINRARFAQEYFTELSTELSPPVCAEETGDNGSNYDYKEGLACPVGAGGGTDNRCFQGPFGDYTHCPTGSGPHSYPLDLYPTPVNNAIYEDKMRIVAPESGVVTNSFSSSVGGLYLGELVTFIGDSGVEYRLQHVQFGTIPADGTRLNAGERIGYYSFDPGKSCNGGIATFTDSSLEAYYNEKHSPYDCGNIHTHVTAIYNGENIDPYLIYGEILGCHANAPAVGQKQDDPVEWADELCTLRSGDSYLLNDNSCNSIDQVETVDDDIIRALFVDLTSGGEDPEEVSCMASRIEPGHYKVQLDPNNLKLNSYSRGAHSIIDFANETGSKVAINANFYGGGNVAIGLYGDTYNPCFGCPVDQAVKAAIAVADNFGGMPMLAKAGKLGLIDLNPFYNGTLNFENVKATTSGLSGVSGILIVKDGQLAQFGTVNSNYSALGWDSNGNLFGYSSTHTSELLAQKMISDGIQNAILLDGGGSQQLYAEGGGVVPSDGPAFSTENLFTLNTNEVRNVPFYIGSSSCVGSAGSGGTTPPPSTGGIPQLNCSEPIKIMPFGDSITVGGSCTTEAGYRGPLKSKLVGSGVEVSFVGSVGTAPNAHEGHGIYNPTMLLNGSGTNHDGCGSYEGLETAVLPGKSFSNADPDIVLVHAGTNNICSRYEQNLTDLEGIVDTIGNKSHVMLATIIPILNGACHEDLYPDFNEEVRALYNSKRSAGSWQNVTLVDMENPTNPANKFVQSDLVGDGVHPTSSGYAKMANIWNDALNPILEQCR